MFTLKCSLCLRQIACLMPMDLGLSTVHGSGAPGAPGAPRVPKTLTLRILGAPGAPGALGALEATDVEGQGAIDQRKSYF